MSRWATKDLGEPTHILVPCWMPKTLASIASKEWVYGLFCSSHNQVIGVLISWHKAISSYHRVYVRNSVFDLKRTPIFVQCMVGCESKNAHQKTCVEKKWDLHDQNLKNTAQDSIHSQPELEMHVRSAGLKWTIFSLDKLLVGYEIRNEYKMK